MNIPNIAKQLIGSSLLLMTMQTAFSEPVATTFKAITCPSIDRLENFDGDLVITAPVSFDINTKAMKTILLQKRKFQNNGTLIFILSGISTTAGEDPEEKAKALIGTLQADTETSLLFHDKDKQSSTSLRFCSYSSQSNNELKGIVFFGPDNMSKHNLLDLAY